MDRPLRHVHAKNGVEGSSPSEGSFEIALYEEYLDAVADVYGLA
jgi:hypothetical protein